MFIFYGYDKNCFDERKLYFKICKKREKFDAFLKKHGFAELDVNELHIAQDIAMKMFVEGDVDYDFFIENPSLYYTSQYPQLLTWRTILWRAYSIYTQLNTYAKHLNIKEA